MKVVKRPVRAGDFGCPDAERGDGSLDIIDFNDVTHVKLLFEQDEEAVDQVADKSLGPQPEGDTEDPGPGDQGANRDANLGEQGVQEEEVAGIAVDVKGQGPDGSQPVAVLQELVLVRFKKQVIDDEPSKPQNNRKEQERQYD